MSVYMVQAGDVGPVKIGQTSSLIGRLQQLQTEHYEVIKLIRLLDGGSGVEHWLHKQFVASHIRGEWFRFDPVMLTIQPGEHVNLAMMGRQFQECQEQIIQLMNSKPDLKHREIGETLGIPMSRLSNWIALLQREGIVPRKRPQRPWKPSSVRATVPAMEAA